MQLGNSHISALFLVIPLITSGVGCTGSTSSDGAALSRSTGNQPPVMVLAKFVHDPIPLSEPIAVQALAEDPDHDTVTYAYQWYINGASVTGQTNSTFPVELLRRGQTVSVEVTPSDGKQQGKPARTSVATVGNTPPKIAMVALSPQAVQPGGKLTAQVEASDHDHDRIDFTYRWYKNDALLKEGDDLVLDTTGLAPRDQIFVEVTARDPETTGNTLRSDSVTLGNTPPTILSTPPVPVTPDHYEYAVRAADSDGDQLLYELETAPAGMAIDRRSGHITWAIPPGNRGIFRVKVVAKDGQGGSAYQEFDLALGVALPGKPAGV